MDNLSNLPPRCLQRISSFSKCPEMPEMTEELPEKSTKRIKESVTSLKKIAQLEADLEQMKKDKDVEMSRWTAKIAQMEANLKIAKLEADLVDERERNRELERKIAETKRKNDDLEANSGPNTEARDGKAKIGELEGKINALQSKNFDLETQIQFEKENKTAEMVKLQADLNRTMTFLNRDGWAYLAKTASWYKVIDQKMTFEEAEAYCASRKSYLVSIHSQEEHDFVWKLEIFTLQNRKQSIIILAKSICLGSPYNWFWIGLKRNPNKGNAFEWTDGSSVDFTNWWSGYPNSNTHAYLSSHDEGWFVGSSAPTYQAPFICKMSSQFS